MTNLCSMCGHPDAHDPLCPNRSEHDRIVRSMDWDTELHAAGTREKTQAISAELDRSTDVIMEQAAEYDRLVQLVFDDTSGRTTWADLWIEIASIRDERDEQRDRIAFLEAANEAGEANYQTIKALLTEVGDAKLALEAENTRMATVEEQRDNWKESARFHLKNEEYYHKERNNLFATVAKHETVIASLVSLLASGVGEDSPEYRWALELIDTPSDGDA